MILDRIAQFADYKQISRRKFCESIGVSASFLSHPGVDIGVSKVKKILETYPEISPEWLLTGKGVMLRPIEDQALSDDEEENEELNAWLTLGKWLMLPRDFEEDSFTRLSYSFQNSAKVIYAIGTTFDSYILDRMSYNARKVSKNEPLPKDFDTKVKSTTGEFVDLYNQLSLSLASINEAIDKKKDVISSIRIYLAAKQPE